MIVKGAGPYGKPADLSLFCAPTIFALRHDGVALTAEHGYPLRLVVPNLYAYKGVKWVRGIELLDRELPGLWEFNGYHIYGDPFKEQRSSS